MASPKEGHAGLTINLPVSVHTRLKLQAVHERRFVTDLIRDAVSNYLDLAERPEKVEA